MTAPNVQEKQKQVDRLRIDLAQVIMDLTQVHTHDLNSHQAKEKAFEGLRNIRQALDLLGIVHSNQTRVSAEKAQTRQL